MIKIDKLEVWGFEHAIRGMRNPLNSWDRMDSTFEGNNVVLGENDLKLMKRLIKGGSEHRKFLRQIMVSVDITAPLYWYKEFDTYKVGTTANSCSTMHKIHAKEFTLDDFSHEHLTHNFGDNREDFVDDGYMFYTALDVLDTTIGALNYYRKLFIETKDKKYWWNMIQLLPSSYNQTRTITLNYENLYSMVHQREGHKLDEWREFVEWVKTLPYMNVFLEGVE